MILQQLFQSDFHFDADMDDAEETIGQLKQKLQENPKDDRARFELALAYYEAKRFKEAIFEFRILCDHHNNFRVDALLARRRCLEMMERNGQRD